MIRPVKAKIMFFAVLYDVNVLCIRWFLGTGGPKLLLWGFKTLFSDSAIRVDVAVGLNGQIGYHPGQCLFTKICLEGNPHFPMVLLSSPLFLAIISHGFIFVPDTTTLQPAKTIP